MLKKTVAFGSLLTVLCASSTLAHGPNFKSGFLAGAHVGISNGSGTFNSNFDTNVPPPGGPGNRVGSGKAKKTSAVFGILGGYRHIFHDGFTVGFDISGNVYTNNELNKLVIHPFNNQLTFVNNLSRRYSVIPSINFGKVFCGRWHAALGLGVGISGFRQKVTAPFPNAANPTTATSTTRKLGFVPSLGIEYAATQNISIVGNIKYEIYKKISKNFNNQDIAFPVAGAKYASSINPKYLTLNIGAVYRF